MSKRKEIMRKVTASVMCMTMLLSGLGSWTPELKAEAAPAETQQTEAQVERSERKMKFNDDWKFKLVDKYDFNNDSVQAEGIDYDDSSWDSVELPHDWAIYQEYENGNGVRAAQGALAGGVGWYRKNFTLSDDFKDKTVSLQFDGVYMISQVWVNGQTLDDWKQYLGYVTFDYDITEFLNFDGQENTIAVKVQSPNDSARWYAGAGIYRNVWLISTEKVNVPTDGVTVTTPLEKLVPETGKLEKIENPTSAGVDIETLVSNDTQTEAESVTVRSTIYDKEGDVKSAQTDAFSIPAGETQTLNQTIDVPDPKLWSTDDPNLYWVRTEVLSDGQVVDTVETRFGIRYTALDPNSGFYLNGVRTPLQGVCEHSDLGALGMEVYPAAIERRIRKLKSMGCNAVRTAHNPVSPEYIEACDRLGMLVFEEAFDQWLHSKNSNDYHNYFNKAVDGTTVVFDKVGNDSIEVKREDLVSNAERDIKAMVSRDKNSPAVFAWSTGNEIDDAIYKHGMDTLEMLTGWIKEIDTTRPVAACPPTWYGYSAWGQQEQHLASAEFSGYNYGQGWYDGAHERYPDMVIFGSETASAFYTRGVYSVAGGREPSEYPLTWNFSSATYSLEMHRDKTYTAGEFVWTGHDYLGEPTPKSWPSKSSYFGIIDTAGFEKDAFYLYKSMWTEIPTVHLLPQNWNLKTGDKVPVYIYTNAASVELFLNGESLGVKNFDKKTASPVYIKWTDSLEYQPGELKAVARDGADGTGNIIATDVVYTADTARNVELSADRAYIKNDGRDLVFVEATITDSAGNMVPDADNEITFNVEGGEIVAVDNGDPTDHDPYRGVNYRKAFSGKALVIVKAGEGSLQDITVTATANGDGGILFSNTVTVESRDELPGDGTDEPELLNTEITIGTGVSAEASLPESVQMLYSNGLLERALVTSWNLEGLDVNQPGEYNVTGTAEGIDGTFTCKVTVKDIKTVEEVNVTTLAQVEPPLPQFVTIEYEDGSIGAAPVTWDEVPEESYAQEGSFTVNGSIGPDLSVTANVYVRKVESVEEVNLETVMGTMPQLPDGVDVTFTDGTTEEIGIDWEITQEDIEAAGDVKITGKILGSDVEAGINLKVLYPVYASDLEWTKAEQEVGTPAKDQTMGGNQLKARVDQGGPPTPYDKGIGTQADSEIEYDITGKGYERFQANITLGFDYGQGALGGVVFKVYADDEQEPRYESQVMTHADKNIPIDVDIKGASKVRLVTEKAAGSGDVDPKYNLADWCDAKFVSGNVTIEEVLGDEDFFYYTDLLEVPDLFDTVEVKVEGERTAKFHVAWPEFTADMFDTPTLQKIEGTVTGTDGGKTKAKVFVDYNNALIDPTVGEKIENYSIKETFNYVSTQGAKVKINTIEDLDKKSTLIGQWTSNLLIENCTHNEYGFNYGVYPDPNNANPEYLIVRAPAIQKFIVRGTANSDSNANRNFTFYTSADGENWTEFSDYEKTADTSWGVWPSRLYTAEKMPEDTHYLKIAFPTGNTWQFNLNEITVEGGVVEKEGVNTIGLNANGGTLPAGTSNKISVKEGEAVGELPVPTRNRYEFKGWFTQMEGGEEITSSYVPEASMVVYAQWERIPAEQDTVPVYFVDSGATAFSEKGQTYVDEYSDTLKNTTPDQAYDEADGWGYTNSDEDVEATGSGDAYSTIRNFKAKHNGLTMTYEFNLEAGNYEVVTGFSDPWAVYANGDRQANITVANAEGTVLAEHEKYVISENRETVTLKDITMAEDGKISVNLKPLVNNEDNLDSCDMLVSFIVVLKKPGAVERHTVTFDAKNGTEPTAQQVVSGAKVNAPEDPQREGYLFEGWFKDEICTQAWDFEADTVDGDITLYAGWTKEEIPDEEIKAGLKAALDIVKLLNAEDFTAETYAVLAQAVKDAMEAYETEGLTAEQIQAEIQKLSDAVKGLENSAKAENEDLKKQLEDIQTELEEEKDNAAQLQTELNNQIELVGNLTEELTTANDTITAKTKELEDKQTELDNLKADAEDKEDQIENLTNAITGLRQEIETEKAKAEELKGKLEAAETELTKLKTEFEESQSRVKLLEAENTRLQKAVQEKEAALKKEQEEAAKAKAEAEEALKKAREEAEKAKAELESLKNSMGLKKGDSVVVKGVRYRVTDAAKKQAEAYGVKNKKAASVNVAATVKINGVVCRVTAIADKAFMNMKRAKKVIIGKNVVTIGKRAFYGDGKLRSILVKGKNLERVGKQALGKISAKAVIRVPKTMKKEYTRIFKGKGQKKTVKVK